MKPSFDPNKERLEQDGSEYLFGATSQPGLFSIPLEKRENYLPQGQVQYSHFADYQDCATRAPLNALKAQLDYAYKTGLMSAENREWYKANGYLDNDLSNRFNAILSGTTKQGNSLKAPLQSIHADGVIPQSLLPETDLTWEQYHDPKAITQKMRDLGAEFAKRFLVSYEKVHRSHFHEVSKDDFLSVALFAWPQPENGVYPATSDAPNHAVAIYKPRYFVMDNYLDENRKNDFIKQLSPDYLFYEEGYRIFVGAEYPYQKQVSLYEQVLALLKHILSIVQTPAPKPEPKPAPTNNLLNAMCLAIQKHEGWYPGSRSYRNNNPGNLVYVGQPGATKEKNGRFCVFATYEDGFAALKNMILNAAKGKSKVYRSDMNLNEFFGVYAPDHDNNDSLRYAKVVAQAMSVDPKTFRLSHLI